MRRSHLGRIASHDCGRVVNPTMVDSQVVGGVTQGLGYALSEERVVDAARGVVLNATLEDYKVPTVADIPPIRHAAADLPDPEANPTGAKGIGEPPWSPPPPRWPAPSSTPRASGCATSPSPVPGCSKRCSGGAGHETVRLPVPCQPRRGPLPPP